MTDVNTTSSPVIPIEELVKPYGINITNIDEIYVFLDMYYDQVVDKSNIKKDFIKYQIDNKFTTVTKVGILIYIYQLGRLNGRYKKEELVLVNFRDHLLWDMIQVFFQFL